LFAPFQFEFPVDELIHDLKYRGALANARVLGTLLGQALQGRGHGGEIDLIVPMPLHASRLEERGFNQSHEIARFTADAIRLPVAGDVLRRERATQGQVGLDRSARRANVQGAFAADPGKARGQRIALIDDVVTTGSTAEAATRALLEAGAGGVTVWAFARALRE
jgi:ComF family protein